jgi:hypothetical protein
MPLRPDALIASTIAPRRLYRRAIVDNYFVTAEILRRRVFADFDSHILCSSWGCRSGELRINPAFLPEPGRTWHHLQRPYHGPYPQRQCIPQSLCDLRVSSADADIDLLSQLTSVPVVSASRPSLPFTVHKNQFVN